jgi:hypothetical protein
MSSRGFISAILFNQELAEFTRTAGPARDKERVEEGFKYEVKLEFT